ncbi:MAG: ribonuclease J [Alphaproteobacteria bacterium]|jgi:ribonuclease J|nr:ribonuclease J [Alphaproteobacteria bacterium]
MRNNTKQYNPEELLFLPLGGAGEIGMNLNLYGYGGKWLMVDLGVTFTQDLGLEVLMPDPAFIVENKKDLVGLVLTHAHEDHIGAVPYLWTRLRCPIYATPFTAALVRAKLKEAGILKEVTLHEIPLGGSFELGPFSLQYISLTHSIPEPNALVIKTGAGVVVHTGDWKIDEDPLIGQRTDVAALQKLGDEGVLALVCDSTNVFEKGHTGSEAEVRKHMIPLIKKQKGRVVVACFASNVARLATAFEAAAQTGRRVALVGRSLHRMLEAARACGYIKTDLLLKEEEVKSIPRDELLLVCTGSQGEPRAALARIAARQHPHVKLEEGDTVIFSSRRIPGNEGQIKSVQEALTQRDIILITDRDAHIHVSGHPSRGDLKDMYTWVRPQILIPVHGENTHMREQAKFGLKCGIPQALVPRNGDILAVNAERAGVVDEVTWGRLALDGMELVPNTGPMVKERQKLASAGVVSISVRLVKGRLKEPPQISLLGVVEREVEARVRQEILDNLEMLVDVTPTEKLTNEATLKELISVTVRRALQAFKGKKPLVMSHIFFS